MWAAACWEKKTLEMFSLSLSMCDYIIISYIKCWCRWDLTWLTFSNTRGAFAPPHELYIMLFISSANNFLIMITNSFICQAPQSSQSSSHNFTATTTIRRATEMGKNICQSSLLHTNLLIFNVFLSLLLFIYRLSVSLPIAVLFCDFYQWIRCAAFVGSRILSSFRNWKLKYDLMTF